MTNESKNIELSGLIQTLSEMFDKRKDYEGVAFITDSNFVTMYRDKDDAQFGLVNNGLAPGVHVLAENKESPLVATLRQSESGETILGFQGSPGSLAGVINKNSLKSAGYFPLQGRRVEIPLVEPAGYSFHVMKR